MKPNHVYSYQDQVHEHQRAQYQPRYVVASRKRRNLTDGEQIALVAMAAAIITVLLWW